MGGRSYFVYIMTNGHNTALYTGVTSDLLGRVAKHRLGRGSLFTSRYRLTKLVYYESGDEIKTMIAREKQIKAGSRAKKIALIESVNPNWEDLYDTLV